MVQKYEALLLTIPEITGDEAKDLETQLDKVVRTGGGTTVSFERWGKYKLAFDVNKSEYGVYYLMRFEVPKGTSLISDMKTYLSVKLNNLVMRDMISYIDPKSPLTYQRPRSLEEAPTREEGFPRENRGSGYFASSDNKNEFDED
jgi:ribosomal protein S6